jgi:7,8-dihydropterin-6-yl-methyl-4-(beta-D-ribofuranosyl)aminobenzene 5'-phosphate synthase
MAMRVLYTNDPGPEELEAAWGFSCLVTGAPETVLFDTGGVGQTLLANMSRLGVEPDSVDVVVLSHEHWDHVGGLQDFLAVRPAVRVYALAAFPEALKMMVRQAGAELVEVTGPLEITAGIWSTGVLQGEAGPPEQALIVDGPGGGTVVTGCAHPGIVALVERAREVRPAGIVAAFGGFHLLRSSREAVLGMATRLRELGVGRAGPCHCSGELAREVFADEFGEGFLDVEVGCLVHAE